MPIGKTREHGTIIELPDIALSIRQPWAHAVAMGWKPLENRSWGGWGGSAGNRNFRGPFAIHAARGMTRDEYESGASFIRQMGFDCPAAVDLLRGGIIGIGRVTDFIRKSNNPWFFGPGALVIADAEPIDFIPSPGRLGFFEWQPGGEPVTPARWMTLEEVPAAIASQQGPLL